MFDFLRAMVLPVALVALAGPTSWSTVADEVRADDLAYLRIFFDPLSYFMSLILWWRALF